MSRWTYVHRYNKLVDEGLAVPLVCDSCADPIIWVIGSDDEPEAFCPREDRKYSPGIYFWSRVKQTVIDGEN